MDWSICIICKKHTQEKVNCPQKGLMHNAEKIYASFLENVDEFRKINSLPIDEDIGPEGTVEAFVRNNASWHRSCHQKFNSNKFKRKLEGKSKDEKECIPNDLRRSKRQKSEFEYKSLCLFCEQAGNKTLHNFQTFEADQSLKRMANDMHDEKLMSKIRGSDIIALEAKYHLDCLTKFRNNYRGHQRKCSSSKSNKETVEGERAHAQAFVELVSYVEFAIQDGQYIFKLSDLHEKYEHRLQSLGYHVSVNKGRLKIKLVDHFFETDVQEQSDGKNVVLVFPEGMQQLLKDALKDKDYQDEAFLFAKVAKICRQEMFGKTHSMFSGSFPTNCQKMLPSLSLLSSMILYGTDMKNNDDDDDSQVCHTIAQMFLHNSKKRCMKPTTHKRQSLDREPPLPIYI